MAVFHSISKSGSICSEMGKVDFKHFKQPASEGSGDAITISLQGKNKKEYSITLYSEEIEQLKKILNVNLPW